jgi:nucleotide-binding universal stress UspA family protein
LTTSRRRRKTGLLLATDGSEFSTAAVKAIAERPWPYGTEVKIISVPEFPLWLGEYPYFQRAQVEELNESALDAARAAVAEAKEILRKAGPQVSTEVPFHTGAALQSILEEAKEWNADLIVAGSHGRRGFDRWAMGSVSESLALNAPCSVEVVRTPTSREMSEKEGELMKMKEIMMGTPYTCPKKPNLGEATELTPEPMLDFGRPNDHRDRESESQPEFVTEHRDRVPGMSVVHLMRASHRMLVAASEGEAWCA